MGCAQSASSDTAVPPSPRTAARYAPAAAQAVGAAPTRLVYRSALPRVEPVVHRPLSRAAPPPAVLPGDGPRVPSPLAPLPGRLPRLARSPPPMDDEASDESSALSGQQLPLSPHLVSPRAAVPHSSVHASPPAPKHVPVGVHSRKANHAHDMVLESVSSSSASAARWGSQRASVLPAVPRVGAQRIAPAT